MLLDIVKEYIFIIYLKILPFIKQVPLEWQIGNKEDVLLIPGYHETYFFLYFPADLLNKHGYKIHIIPDFNHWESIEDSSMRIVDYIESNKLNNLILLSHSRGGLIAKYFLDNSGLEKKVKYSISIATPYKGTVFGKLNLQNLHELKPGSKIIKKILTLQNSNSKILNFYPKFDNHVIPNSNLLLEGARNIEIPINGHTRILRSNKLYAALITALAAD